MTDSIVTTGVVAANALAVVVLANADVNPLLEYMQNGVSVGAVMSIFLWREVKRAERYEKLYDQERKLRMQAERKCSSCEFVQRANAEFIEKRDESASS